MNQNTRTQKPRTLSQKSLGSISLQQQYFNSINSQQSPPNNYNPKGFNSQHQKKKQFQQQQNNLSSEKIILNNFTNSTSSNITANKINGKIVIKKTFPNDSNTTVNVKSKRLLRPQSGGIVMNNNFQQSQQQFPKKRILRRELSLKLQNKSQVSHSQSQQNTSRNLNEAPQISQSEVFNQNFPKNNHSLTQRNSNDYEEFIMQQVVQGASMEKANQMYFDYKQRILKQIDHNPNLFNGNSIHHNQPYPEYPQQQIQQQAQHPQQSPVFYQSLTHSQSEYYQTPNYNGHPNKTFQTEQNPYNQQQPSQFHNNNINNLDQRNCQQTSIERQQQQKTKINSFNSYNPSLHKNYSTADNYYSPNQHSNQQPVQQLSSQFQKSPHHSRSKTQKFSQIQSKQNKNNHHNNINEKQQQQINLQNIKRLNFTNTVSQMKFKSPVNKMVPRKKTTSTRKSPSPLQSFRRKRSDDQSSEELNQDIQFPNEDHFIESQQQKQQNQQHLAKCHKFFSENKEKIKSLENKIYNNLFFYNTHNNNINNNNNNQQNSQIQQYQEEDQQYQQQQQQYQDLEYQLIGGGGGSQTYRPQQVSLSSQQSPSQLNLKQQLHNIKIGNRESIQQKQQIQQQQQSQYQQQQQYPRKKDHLSYTNPQINLSNNPRNASTSIQNSNINFNNNSQNTITHSSKSILEQYQISLLQLKEFSIDCVSQSSQELLSLNNSVKGNLHFYLDQKLKVIRSQFSYFQGNLITDINVSHVFTTLIQTRTIEFIQKLFKQVSIEISKHIFIENSNTESLEIIFNENPQQTILNLSMLISHQQHKLSLQKFHTNNTIELTFNLKPNSFPPKEKYIIQSNQVLQQQQSNVNSQKNIQMQQQQQNGQNLQSNTNFNNVLEDLSDSNLINFNHSNNANDFEERISFSEEITDNNANNNAFIGSDKHINGHPHNPSKRISFKDEEIIINHNNLEEIEKNLQNQDIKTLIKHYSDYEQDINTINRQIHQIEQEQKQQKEDDGYDTSSELSSLDDQPIQPLVIPNTNIVDKKIQELIQENSLNNVEPLLTGHQYIQNNPHGYIPNTKNIHNHTNNNNNLHNNSLSKNTRRGSVSQQSQKFVTVNDLEQDEDMVSVGPLIASENVNTNLLVNQNIEEQDMEQSEEDSIQSHESQQFIDPNIHNNKNNYINNNVNEQESTKDQQESNNNSQINQNINLQQNVQKPPKKSYSVPYVVYSPSKSSKYPYTIKIIRAENDSFCSQEDMVEDDQSNENENSHDDYY